MFKQCYTTIHLLELKQLKIYITPNVSKCVGQPELSYIASEHVKLCILFGTYFVSTLKTEIHPYIQTKDVMGRYLHKKNK